MRLSPSTGVQPAARTGARVGAGKNSAPRRRPASGAGHPGGDRTHSIRVSARRGGPGFVADTLRRSAVSATLPEWLELTRGGEPLVVSIPHTGTGIPDEIAYQLVSPWL